jgi:hypothetical protein
MSNASPFKWRHVEAEIMVVLQKISIERNEHKGYLLARVKRLLQTSKR